MPIELWPPLSVIRSHLAPGQVSPAPQADAGDQAVAPQGTRDIDLQLPLAELARRRQVLAARNFNARWEPGRIVSVLHEGRLLGVLLDRKLPEGGGKGVRWQGFMAASEADWAGAHDVLLEPTDEPFEPLFGLIQAWNQVTLAPMPQQVARVQGEVSATRLAAIRAVHDEYVNGTRLAIEPEPGHIALRSVGGGHFTVLSGTPLAEDDVRLPYQQLYRDAALRLSASVPAAPPATLARQAPPHTPSAPRGPIRSSRRPSSGIRTSRMPAAVARIVSNGAWKSKPTRPATVIPPASSVVNAPACITGAPDGVADPACRLPEGLNTVKKRLPMPSVRPRLSVTPQAME